MTPLCERQMSVKDILFNTTGLKQLSFLEVDPRL